MTNHELNENDQRVIAAVIRENSIAESYVQVKILDEIVSGLIVRFQENGIGRKVSIRAFTLKVALRVDGQNINSQLNCYHIAKIQAVDAIYEFGVKLTEYNGDEYTFEIVGPLAKEDRRKRHRSSLEQSFESPIVLESESGISLGMAKVCDYSFCSLGVEIRTLKPLDVTLEYVANGTLSINDHIMILKKSTMRRLHKLSNFDDEKIYIYSAGIVFANSERERSGERLSQRVIPDFLQISVNSCLAPNFEIFVELLDMATSGFKGNIRKKQDKQLLWTGCGLRLHGSDLRGTVVFADERSVRVEWFLDGGSGEKYWSDLVSGARNPGSDLSLSSAEELMTSFIRSGTASAGYLNHLSLLSENTVKGLSTESKYPDWFFKWIERDDRGKIKGHIAGYRLADNLWCAGDLFSDPDQNFKISADFSKKFLTHFVDFLQRKTPIPKVYGAWKKGHPYWEKTEKYLNENPDVLYSDLTGVTYFTDFKKNISYFNDFDMTEVIDGDRILTQLITKKLEKNNLLSFARAFDFDEDRFASPRTREQFAFRSFIFRRKYFLIKHSNSEYLVICSRFPYGVSPYNNTSITFVLPLGESSNDFSSVLADQIALITAKNGIYPHRVTLLFSSIMSGDQQQSKNRIVIVQPKMWLNT